MSHSKYLPLAYAAGFLGALTFAAWPVESESAFTPNTLLLTVQLSQEGEAERFALETDMTPRECITLADEWKATINPATTSVSCIWQD